MQCWNNRLLNRSLSTLKTRQRYQSQIFDFYLREAKNKKKSIEEILDLNNTPTD